MSRASFSLAVGMVFASLASGQGIQEFKMQRLDTNLPNSNSVDVLTVSRDTVWFGTGGGLSTSTDGTSWRHFANTGTFDNRGISAIALNDEIVWVASAFFERLGEDLVETGGGLRWTTDRGSTWTYVPQPVDTGSVNIITYGINQIRALAVTVPEQNVTYDIALTPNTVWIASWAGMLRRSTDRGQSWLPIVLPPDNLNSISPDDTLDFDLAPAGGTLGLRPNLNHVVFSVFASNDSTLWVGTAAGINKSTDGGIRWQRFSHQNQSQPISGNFVVALNGQQIGSQQMIWAATVNAVDADEYPAVSYSTDGGNSWTVTLAGERVHNIAFKDSIVYVAANRGLFRSTDKGASWTLTAEISDLLNGQKFTNPAIVSIAVRGDTVWVGGPNGAAYTLENSGQAFGSIWRVFRTYEPLGNSYSTYSFPSPFSPDDEPVRLHYSTHGATRTVSIRIFDFGMNPVRTLLDGSSRSGAYEHDEIWDGKDDRGRRVANGVYFYRIEMEQNSPLWGKIFVIR